MPHLRFVAWLPVVEFSGVVNKVELTTVIPNTAMNAAVRTEFAASGPVPALSASLTRTLLTAESPVTELSA